MEGPDLETVIATLRAFLRAAGAERAMALLDRGARRPGLVLDGTADGPFAVAGDDDELLVPEEATSETVPLALPTVKPLPPPAVDAVRGELTAPMGALALQAGAVRDVALALGGRSVLTVQFATTDPDAPLSIAARRDEPIELALGLEQFTMPADWPG